MDATDTFERERARLTGLAHRMLGSRADAEDAVQEAWLRLARTSAESIDNLPAWLTTVVSRVCIDVLRSRQARPEADAGDALLDLLVTEDVDPGPEERAVLADSVGRALLAVLDTLTPDERLAFVLHDSFGLPFAEIATVLGKSTDAAKMLASRARAKVRGRTGTPETTQQRREVVDAFLAAARDGDFDRLLTVLHPEVTWTMHTPRGAVVRHGAHAVAAPARGGNTRLVARRVLVNGEPGALAWTARGNPLVLMVCTIEGEKITAIESITDRRILDALDLPPREPVTSAVPGPS